MPGSNTHITQIAQALVAKHAAVMVGAGFSRNADKKYSTNREFLDWKKLSDLFYDKLYEDGAGPGKMYASSLGLAEQVERLMGRPVLEEILHQAVPDEDYIPSELFRKLMELPWRDVFTTNYDTLLERTADQITKRRYNVVVCKEDLAGSNDASRIVKLHGSFPSSRPFIITEEDYRTYPEKFAPMVNTVQQAFLENVFCMIGFSGEDPNFIKWTGWIRDHLSKSSAQKLYMITVSHLPEAQRTLFIDRNIIAVDLEEIWPDCDISERLAHFFDYLREYVWKNEEKERWIIEDLDRNSSSPNYQERTEKLREIRESYPGWVFLPSDKKAQASMLLDSMNQWVGFDQIPWKDQIDYIFEFVKLCDIVDRPILLNDAERFQDIIELDTTDATEEIKKQEIRLHLMRAYRENGRWEEAEKYQKTISDGSLNYVQRQFYKAECCRIALFRFDGSKLRAELANWEIAAGDVYWPLIKAYLLAAAGMSEEADKLLTANLRMIRRPLMRDAKNAFLVSMEECCVSLVNYIRQSKHWDNTKEKFEQSTNQADISWKETNRYYISQMKEEFKTIKEEELYYSFNLTRTYTIHFGSNQNSVLTALEYWRFLEKTGHAFCIGNVTMRDGLDGSVKRLGLYYPYWAMVQTLIAEKKETVDLLSSRKLLAGLTAEEADEDVQTYINLLQAIAHEVSNANEILRKNIFDQAAVVLPMLLASYVCKCSEAMLDKTIDVLLEICINGEYHKFRKLKELMNAVVNACGKKKQSACFEKFLQFPIAQDKFSGYVNPCQFCRVPDQKLKLKRDTYKKLMYRIEQELQSSDPDRKRSAVNFQFVLCYQIEIDEKDMRRLLKQLEDDAEYSVLYTLTKDKKYAEKIAENVFASLTLQGKTGMFPHAQDVNRMLDIADVVDFTWDNASKWFLKLIQSMDKVIEKEKRRFEDEEEIRGYVKVTLVILASIYYHHEPMPSEEIKKEIEKFLELVATDYENMIPLRILTGGLWGEHEYAEDKLEQDLWKCGAIGISLIENMIYILRHSRDELKKDPYMMTCVEKIENIFGYRLMDVSGEKEMNLIDLFCSLRRKDYLKKSALPFLNMKLMQLIDETAPCIDDAESCVREKILMRTRSCALAAALQGLETQIPAVEEWRRIGVDENEFMEVRNVKW